MLETPMLDKAEDATAHFYRTVGWESEEGITEDAKRWEDLRPAAAEYVSRCRLRILPHIPDRGDNILDMASGPIQYPEYLEFSRNYSRRYCVDLSENALAQAKRRIGDHGVFLQGSFFDIPLEADFFDCALSLHTIYHMNRDRQEEAVRKLIRVVKPGRPVIIVYSNPDTWIASLKSIVTLRFLRRKSEDGSGSEPYFYRFPMAWWQRFTDVARVQVLPWRSFAANAQRALIPDNALGRRMLGILFRLEERFPEFFIRHFQYPMIVLTKNESTDSA
jgi:ubiquinone/menaquinone biosynthesis C-methylase UbiE